MRELQSAMDKLMSKEPMTFNEDYSLECLFHESVHANKAGLKSSAYTPINYKLIEGCTQIYARQNYVKILDAFGTKSAHFNTIKYAGYGYKELVNKLRPFVTDKNGNLLENDVLKIAHEESYPKDKFFSIIKANNPNFSNAEIYNY
ncbi:MAG: hypothetical protein J6I79_03190 [Paludibacteraceae bacterium]|nr:hypothetical protein [Paludibacteraceae bacterium]